MAYKKVIINADDFGYSSQVNEAVAECFRTGVINRTTIMVNMSAAGRSNAEIKATRGVW